MKTCEVESCDNPARTRGLCSKHYYRLLKHGDPQRLVKLTNGETLRYFNEVVLLYEGHDCLIWPYSRTKGYGVMTIDGHRAYVHREACIKVHGHPPTPNHLAAHNCGNGHQGCCNPTHVYWATNAENQKDRVRDGTYQFGELNPTAKLTEADVLAIRAMKGEKLQREIADMFGISRENVSAIHRNKSWALPSDR